MRHEILVQSIGTRPWREALFRAIDSDAAATLRDATADELGELFARVMRVPVELGDIGARVPGRSVFTLFYLASWLSALDRLAVPRNAATLEIAAGDTVYVPVALDIHTAGGGSYVTANLNEELTAGFRAGTAGLRIPTRVVEDHAANLAAHCEPESFDLVAFQHAVNDLVQTAVADENGIDTVHLDWFEILPTMVRLVMEYHRDGRLETNVRSAFVGLMATAASLLRPGGHMVFNNCVFQVDLEAGYETDLYASFISLARRWIARSGLELEIVDPEWIDPQWWMVVRKR